ncbi:ribosomal protein S19 binding protein 1 [Neoarius graeffei]|uniref:ribosomal protein S19 binding protein 1 n=1 Tax=Neoarius graeffei TaxID=443677 RepID=UPI00298C479B|nr:ribosomal protein S19 binding protein 1 [Neoarius graeffei]
MSSSLLKRGLELFNEDPKGAAKVHQKKKKKSTKKASVMDQISTNKQGVRKRLRRVQGRKSRKNKVMVKDKRIRNALELYRKKQKKSQLDANLRYFLKNSYKMEESCTKKIAEQSVGRQSRHKPEKPVKKREKRPIFTEAEFQKFQEEYFSKL